MKDKFLCRKTLITLTIALNILGMHPAIAKEGQDLKNLTPWNEKNMEVRDEYNEFVNQEYEKFKVKMMVFHQNKQSIGEDLAREASKVRDEIKKMQREKTSEPERSIGIPLRNIKNKFLGNLMHSWKKDPYFCLNNPGHCLNVFKEPDYDYFLARGRTPEEIAYHAFKTGGEDLGLKNNGFGDIITIWEAIKSTGNLDIYPEHLNQEDVAWFKARANGKLTKEGALTKEAVLASYEAYLTKIGATTPALPWVAAEKVVPEVKIGQFTTSTSAPPALTADPATLPQKAPAVTLEGATAPPPPQVVVVVDPRIDAVATHLADQADQLKINTQAITQTKHQVAAVEQQVAAVNNRTNHLEKEIQKNDKKAIRGIAAVAALGYAVFPSAPGKTVVNAGISSYEHVQALAISISHRPEKLSRLSFQAGIGASTAGKPVMRVGAGYEF